MNTYIYILKLNERLYDDQAWTEEDNKILEKHFLRLKQDFEANKIIHVGRTENPKDDGFGVVIYKATDDEEAKSYMLSDPAIVNDLMSGTFKPYKVIFS